MANNKSMFQKPMFWLAVASLGIVGYAATGSDGSKAAAHTKSPTKKSSPTKKADNEITKEDLNANFGPVNDSAHNSFVPIVARHSGIGVGDGLANVVPSDMTGGEANWVYTGTATTDGVPVALIENRTSGDAVFLKKGERWKSAYVLRISEYSVIMSGPSGTRTLGLVDETLKSGNSLARNQDFAPAQVDVPNGFGGQIGGGGNNGGGGRGNRGFGGGGRNRGQQSYGDNQTGYPAYEPNNEN